MTILSAQAISRLSRESQLITPFSTNRIVNGKSLGLSACSYDCTIDQDLVLTPMPWPDFVEILNILINKTPYVDNIQNNALLKTIAYKSKNCKALASTMEHFSFPANVCGSVLDKSSYARLFVSAFNTHLDPGWRGYLTVELVNLGDTEIVYKKGDSLCQIKFEWLDEPTILPYQGKYQNQPNKPVETIYEKK